jgi:hypothetical protein
VALNSAISGGGDASDMHRVAGHLAAAAVAANLNNNYGWTGVVITPTSGTATPDVGVTKVDGADVTTAELIQTFYEGLGWDFTATTGVWAMDANGYPKLQWQTAAIARSPL